MKLKRKLLKGLYAYTEDQVWEAVVKKKNSGAKDDSESSELREPEWEVFSNPDPNLNSRNFRLRVVEPPRAYRKVITKVVLAEKLREVRALIGFTRIESPGQITPNLETSPRSSEFPSLERLRNGCPPRMSGERAVPPVLGGCDWVMGEEDQGTRGGIPGGSQVVA